MAAEPRGSQRRGYLDFLRGIAVLLMIDAHLLDSWTRVPDRETAPFAMAMLFGGMGTTLFLALAGVAVALSAGSKLRRTQDRAAASAAVARRGVDSLRSQVVDEGGNLRADRAAVLAAVVGGVVGLVLWRRSR